MDAAEALSSQGSPSQRSPSPRSPAQSTASRLNGARSQGPATAEGRARSARNATRHGLCAKNFYLLPDEDPEAFLELLDELADCYDPQTVVELHWVEEVAFAMWRQKRLRLVSAAIFAGVKFPFPEALLDDPIVEARVPPSLGRELAAMARYRARIDKDLDKAMAILDRIQRARLIEEQQALEARRTVRNEPGRAGRAVRNEPERQAPTPSAAAPQAPLNRQQRRYLERQAQKRARHAS